VVRPTLELAFEAQSSVVRPTVYDLAVLSSTDTAAKYTGSSQLTDITSTGGSPIFQGRSKAMLVSSGLPADLVASSVLDYVVSVNFKIKNLFVNNADIATFCGNQFSGTFTGPTPFEPIYMISLDGHNIGLFLTILDCRSSTHAYDKTLKIGFKIDSGTYTGATHTFTLSSIRS
jgi:hypothetical protein